MLKSELSVVIPTFNRSYCLERAIVSVFEQELLPNELIVVDDGSEDGTADLLNRLAKLAPVDFKVFKQNNQGVSSARNLGITKSRGEYLAFLDSDDEWLPQKLFLQLEEFEKDEKLGAVHGEEIWIRHGVRVNPKKKHKKYGGHILKHCFPLCCISPSAVVIKRAVFEAIGNFKESFPVCEDYDLWLRLCSRYKIGFVSEPLVKKYGGHEDQLSKKYKAMDYWRLESLHQLLQSGDCPEDLVDTLKSEMLKKANVLILGYRKHGHMEKAQEIEKKIRSALLNA